jgi:hypothetical protein
VIGWIEQPTKRRLFDKRRFATLKRNYVSPTAVSLRLRAGCGIAWSACSAS